MSQQPPQDPTDDLAFPKDSPHTPAAASLRSAGRAERLRVEDAADQSARQHRYKNFDIGDAPSETALDGADQDATIHSAESKSGGGIGRVVSLFVVLVVMAGVIIGTASWWIPRLTQIIQGTVAPSRSAPSLPVQSAQPAPEPEATAASAAPLTVVETLQALEQGGGAGDASVLSLSQSLSSQAQQLTAVSARLATLEAAIGNTARVEDLGNRIVILEGKSADAASVLTLSDRVAALEDISRRAIAEQTAEVALLMAAAQLREAVVAGRPFEIELETTKALAAHVLDTSIEDEGFAAYAARGVPSLSALQRRFDETAARVVRAEMIPEGANGWLRQSLDRLMSIVTVRRVDGTPAGNSASAVLARSENRLLTGNIAGAAVEMTALTGAAAEAAAPWLADASARIAADRAITTVLRGTMALMAVETRPPVPTTSTSESK